MKLPLLKNIFPSSPPKPDYFLTLILRADLVKAVVYEKLVGKISVVGGGEEPLNRLIDDIDVEELLEICDRVIGVAEEKLAEDIQATKTIFGIREDWQKNGKIQKPYLEKLRRIKQDLELTPLGFMVIPEAIAYLLQSEEGAPINAVLVELGRKVLTVSLLRASRLAESKSVLLTDGEEKSVPLTIETTLKGFLSFEVLPSRIILFDGEMDLESMKQACIVFPFAKGLPFLHVPRIEVLPRSIDEKAVILGISSEMGLAVEQERTEVFSPPKEVSEEIEEEELIGEELAFGFKRDEEPTISTITKKFTRPSIPQINVPLTLITANLSAFFKSLSLPSLPPLPLKGLPRLRRILVIPLAMLLVALILIMSYLFFLKATVELTVIPKIVEDDREVLVDANLKEASQDNRLKGEILTVTQEGALTSLVKGKKEVGEAAKGSVKIGNTSEVKKTFSKGTVLVGPHNLKFELVDSVTVASRSAGSFEIPSSIGTIEALQIGEESNLPTQTSLTFPDFPSSLYFATTEGLSGGSKREVTVVAREDQDHLMATLSAKLKEQAVNVLSQKDGAVKIIDIISEKSIEKKFDRKIDEEAKNISLSLKVEFQAIGFKEKDLQNFFIQILPDKVENRDFILLSDNLELTTTSFEKRKDGTVKMKVKGKAKFIPQFDSSAIKKTITGKSKNESIKYLKSLPNVSEVTIKISPLLPLFSNNLPMVMKNIKLTVNTKD